MAEGKLVLVVNAGSSSLKYKAAAAATALQRSGAWWTCISEQRLYPSMVFRNAVDKLTASVSGLLERIGDPAHSSMHMTALEDAEPQKQSTQIGIKDHTEALNKVLSQLETRYGGDLQSRMEAVGHRVVHGREISEARVVNESVLTAIRDAAKLAPLHNPANLEGILAAGKVFSCPQVAVFDTAFLQTMPPAASTYALPAELAEREGLRRYGAHGTSYRYLVSATSQLLRRPASELNLIIGHIGAGASMACIRGGKVIDTSMGMTPLEGLVMGTRCGDVDAAVVLYLAEHCGMKAHDIDMLLNKQSGLLGLAGNSDLRSVVAAADSGDAQSKLAIEVFVHRLRGYLGRYLIQLEGKTDAIVFSAGIGENSALVRSRCLKGLEAFGIVVDEAKNQAALGGATAKIQADSSAIRILVVPTDEERSIAEQTLEAVELAQTEA